MDEPTFTCVAKCQHCGAELLRREGVALPDRQSLVLAIPDLAICKEADHNTMPEVPQNYGADIEWYREKRTRRGKIYKLIRETRRSPYGYDPFRAGD